MTSKRSEIPGLVQKKLNEFFDIIDDLFVSHFVNIYSINFYRKFYLPKLKETLLEDANISGVSLADIYKKSLHVGDEDETQSMVYQTTFEQIFSIAETPGKLENRLAGNLVVTIYQYWEDTYRGKIASLLGIKKDDLRGDIWGDLRHIRRSLLHREFLAVEEIVQCKIIKAFSPGEPIKFNYEILKSIKTELHNWYNEFLYSVTSKYNIKPFERDKEDQLSPS